MSAGLDRAVRRARPPGRPEAREPGLGPQYTKLWAASTVSAVGDGMSLTAAPLLASRLTSDPGSIAAVTAMLTIPYVLFGLPAGLLADRIDLRRAMAATDWGRTGVVAALTVCTALGVRDLPVLYVCFFLVGTGETFFRNASQILVPHLVPPSSLVAANSRQQAAQIGANQFVGPLVGAALFVVAAALPFGVDSCTFLVSAVLLTRLRVPSAAADPASASAPDTVTAPDMATGTGTASVAIPTAAPAPPRPRLSAELLAGVAWLWRHPLLRTLSATAALINFVSMGALAILVVEAHTVLRLGDLGYGVLLACQAVGAVLAARVSPALSRRIGGEWALVLVVLAIAVGYGAVWALRSPVAAGAALALAACADVTWNVVVVHLRQTLVPLALRGRVNSVYRLVAWGAMPVGATAAGILATAAGASCVFGVGALLMAATAVPLAVGARNHWFDRAGAVVR